MQRQFKSEEKNQKEIDIFSYHNVSHGESIELIAADYRHC